MNPEDLITAKEAGEILGQSRDNVLRLGRIGKIPISDKVGFNRSKLFKRSDVTNFLNSEQTISRRTELSASIVTEIVYRVKSGESMSALAKEFKTSTKEVYKHVLKSYKK